MSGAVHESDKHVVALELHGPRNQAEYEAFRDAVEALAARYNARIIIRARGKKEKSGTEQK